MSQAQRLVAGNARVLGNENAFGGAPLGKDSSKPATASQRLPLGVLTNTNVNKPLLAQTQKAKALHHAGLAPQKSMDDNCMSDDVYTPAPQAHMNLLPHITATLAEEHRKAVHSTMTVEEAADPQMVSVYFDDIMKHLRTMEIRRQPNPQYMTRQTDINAKMREILIDWLVEVHLKFKLKQETLYLTVNIIDRFLDCRAVARSKLQLVGCTAMLIASKYEEIYAPEVQDFVYVSDKAYNREHILAMESIMLNVLEFNVTVPYATRFAENYIRLLNPSEEFHCMVNFLIELTLQEYKFLNYLPSHVAASAISLALHLSGQNAWSRTLQDYTGYSEGALRGCVLDLWALAAKDAPKYRAVRKKYASQRFHGVSRTVINPPNIPASNPMI